MKIKGGIMIDENAGISESYLTANLKDFAGIDIAPVMEWVNKPNGLFFVYGKCGCGKTHLAYAIKRHFNLKNISSMLTTSYAVIGDVKDSFKSEFETESSIIKQYAPDPNSSSGNLYIFDDIGMPPITEYDIGIWGKIIDRRWLYNKPALFISNLSPKALFDTMGDRIASRLSKRIFLFEGEDRRASVNYRE